MKDDVFNPKAIVESAYSKEPDKNLKIIPRVNMPYIRVSIMAAGILWISGLLFMVLSIFIFPYLGEVELKVTLFSFLNALFLWLCFCAAIGFVGLFLGWLGQRLEPNVRFIVCDRGLVLCNGSNGIIWSLDFGEIARLQTFSHRDGELIVTVTASYVLDIKDIPDDIKGAGSAAQIAFANYSLKNNGD